jgi:2-C-methyl-D-erythritol 4-phosphate cytidylyltransferase/2-C-methyl-D-erythritol 2,4-cyclodiphosphate synthase
MTPTLIAIVPAGGVGARAATADGVPKQYRPLAGQPMVRRAVRALLADARVTQVRVAVAAGDAWAQAALAGLPRTVVRRCAGATRADTVRAALRDADLPAHAWVLVHDAARPGLPAEALARLIETCLRADRGGILALPAADTVKQARPAAESADLSEIAATRPRESLWLAQTPQMFRAGALLAALEATAGDARVTDEASAVELAGGASAAPLLVPGARENLKLTWPGDFAWFETWMAGASAMNDTAFRVGQGHDLHRLVEGRPLVIGGVTIPYDRGLAGHSDADVLLHAVTDAVLGAAGLGDIGRHFSDRDPRWAGADSRLFLREAARLAREAGWKVVNVDATVHAQAPKLAPHAAAMAAHVAQALGIVPEDVNVKAKTAEGLGPLGRGEGIAADAVVLLARG